MEPGSRQIPLPSSYADEVARGARFAFGKNWASFLTLLSEERIRGAEGGLVGLLGHSLHGVRFLDVGSGSGLSSLAARRLGASVVSFDFDPQSVSCTAELRRRYFPDDPAWVVHEGSALDGAFLESLGTFDVVYSWGVLHHTGAMWRGLDLAGQRVAPGGRLLIAIYNDQGAWSSRWLRIKRLYCSGWLGRGLVVGSVIPVWVLRDLAADIVWGRNPLLRYQDHHTRRGMSKLHDWLDWLGGLPFEVAKPEQVLRFFRDRGMTLTDMTTAGGSMGCNEYLFQVRNGLGDARKPPHG